MPDPAPLHLGQRSSPAELAQKVAEVGASLCCYAPGAGNPEAWPTSRCDCKFGASGHGEQTGCCEARALHRLLTNNQWKPWWMPS